ncbi:MAG: type VI secretion system tip protein TssI/VgrG [Myxococcota bacterium]
MNDSNQLSRVRYAVRIEVPERPDHPAQSYDEEHWQVREFELDEGVDRPYVLDILLLTPDPETDIDGLVGARFTLSCRREDDERFVQGLVQRAWYLGTFTDRVRIRLEVGPALSTLELSRRSRVFQAQTAVQIVEQVVAEAIAPHDRSIDASRLLRSYDPADYCVQFQETDLDFVTRLLAREGIGYFFEHDDTVETMVLFDDPKALQGVSVMPGGEAQRPPPVVPVRTSGLGHAEEETVVAFEWRRRTRTRRVERSAWDWKPWEPGPARSRTELETDAPWAMGEHYEHGERRLLEEHGTGPHLDHTSRSATDGHERRVAASQAAIGQGNLLSFGPGQTFELEGHPHAPLDREYALVRVVHRADCPDTELFDDGAFAGANYENRFECVPAELPWRPRPRPRPSVHGHLLATVVGPAGEEIHTDEHGRIKAWIHWDREHGPDDEDSSCWIRVAQPWAGAGWGSMFIPRVGMEVLVSFAGGDPDQPLCVGSVYNGHNQPPYSLPDDRTKSTLKSRSTPGGDGFNELRFEDSAGNEEVFLHAQRDLNEVVGHNHQRTVAAQEGISVGADRNVSVQGSQTVTIQGNQQVSVKGRTSDGAPEPAPHYSIDVDSDFNVAATKHIHLKAEESITLQVQGTTLTLTPQGLVLGAGNGPAGDGASVSIDQKVLLRSTPGATLELTADGPLAVAAMAGPQTPGATLELDANAKVASQAGASLNLAEDVNLTAPESGPGAALTLDTNVSLTGHKVLVQGESSCLMLDQNATLEGSGVTVRGDDLLCEASKTTLAGQQITAQGGAQVTITAPLVKIN